MDSYPVTQYSHYVKKHNPPFPPCANYVLYWGEYAVPARICSNGESHPKYQRGCAIPYLQYWRVTFAVPAEKFQLMSVDLVVIMDLAIRTFSKQLLEL